MSAGGGATVGAILVGSAIAIPNLLRARMASNEAAAIGALRTVNTAQIAYAASYPQRGFARSLAALGPDPRGGSAHSAEHANMLDATLGDASCAAGAWCEKSGYRFSLKAACAERGCREFVVTATPVSSNTGTRNFCSTSDGVIRSNVGPVMSMPLSAAECRKWPPLQ